MYFIIMHCTICALKTTEDFIETGIPWYQWVAE